MEISAPAARERFLKQSFANLSFSDERSISSVDLNKKRKLQYESGSLDMPSPKQRFRVGTRTFGQGLVNKGDFHEEPIVREIQNDLEQPEKSEHDSNSFIGAYDNSMEYDFKDANENSITLTVHQDQPSTSLNSYSNGIFKSHLYSLESRDSKEVNNVTSVDLEDTLPFDPGYKVMEDMYPDFGLDHAISELASEGNAETETMNLYSDDVAPHSLILSSGRWNLRQGAPLGARKPTIDQEFEQYFSSLML